MENILLEKTKNLPRVSLNTSGLISFEGRMTAEDSSEFFKPLFQWLQSVDLNNVIANIKLEYINTSASKYMYNFFKLIQDNQHVSNIKIKWYYEEDDENLYDMGKYLEAGLKKCNFEFVCISMDSEAA